MNAKVYVHDYDENIFTDGEELINVLIEEDKIESTTTSNCQWMIVDNLSIEVL